jgi:hypothetical protein
VNGSSCGTATSQACLRSSRTRVRQAEQQLESVRLAGAYHSTVVQARLGEEAHPCQAQKKEVPQSSTPRWVEHNVGVPQD